MPETASSSREIASRQRQAFQAIARAVSARQAAADVLGILVNETRDLLDVSTVAVALHADQGNLLDFVAVAGDNAPQLVGLRIRADESFASEVLRTAEPLVTGARPAENGGRSGTSPSRSHGPAPDPQRASAVMPVLKDGHVMGALFALNRRSEDGFGPEDVELLRMLADCVTLAVVTDADARAASDRARELAVLYDAAHTVSGSLNIQEVLDSVLSAICDHVEHQAAVLFLLNDEGTHLFIGADRGLTDADREIQLAADGRMTAQVLATGDPMLISDTDAEPEFETVTMQAWTRSAMIAPVRSRHDTMGLVIVTSTQPDAYTQNDLKLIATVASQAGIAISNAWLYEDATRRAEEATALYDLSQAVNATLQLDKVFQFVADSVLNLLSVDKFALMLIDEREDRLITRASRGVNEETFGAIKPRPGEGIAGWVFEWMTPTAVADIAADARNRAAPIHQEGITSTICVPMAMGDDVIGVVLAMSSRRRLFTVAEMELLYTISNQAAIAIINAMLYQDARSRSTEMRRYLHRIAKALGSSLETQDVPQLLADLAVEVMRGDRCAIYRIEGDAARVHVTSRFRPSTPPDESVPLGEGLTGWVAKRGKSLAVPSLADDPRARAHQWLSRERLTSYLAVPLKVGRKTVGVVEIYAQGPREFSSEEAKLLAQFVSRARVAERVSGEM